MDVSCIVLVTLVKAYMLNRGHFKRVLDSATEQTRGT